MTTGYGLDGGVFGVRVEFSTVKNFLHIVQTGSGSTQPPIEWVPGAVKRPGSEADHSPPASVEFKEDLYVHSLIRLHGVVLNSLSTRTTLPCMSIIIQFFSVLYGIHRYILFVNCFTVSFPY
jgi:hypothetical protein